MYRILIADDEAIERRALQRVIRTEYSENIEMMEAVNGIDALDKFKTFKPDIIFCDIKMPGKSGLEVIREIKESNPEQIAVFLSAYDYFDYAREAVSLGVKEYLIKPVSDSQVISLVQKCMQILDNKKKREQELSEQAKKLAILDAYFKNTFNTSLTPEDSLAVQYREIEHKLTPRLEKLLKNAVSVMEERYAEPITLENIADKLKLSSFYFSKMFKIYWGKTFTDYLNEIRIKESCKMLANPSLRIKEIAAYVGFSNANYFSRVFKQIRNMTPCEYRNKILN